MHQSAGDCTVISEFIAMLYSILYLLSF